MDLLLLFNAAVNFALYGSMSKQFRDTFKSFIKGESQITRLQLEANQNYDEQSVSVQQLTNFTRVTNILAKLSTLK